MITEFTPYLSLVGGVMIGGAAALLMLMLGRIMGISGMISGSVWATSFEDMSWRVTLLIGILISPVFFWLLTGEFPSLEIGFTTPSLIIGGLITGIGVTLGGGCTSGHGVCGNARIAKRSIVSTLIFMTSAFVTVYIIRHVLMLTI